MTDLFPGGGVVKYRRFGPAMTKTDLDSTQGQSSETIKHTRPTM